MDKRKPIVSIVTIVYNGEKYLEQTIQSVLNQTYSNIEYIIIDGGSTDDTIDIIKKYSDQLAYWISEKDSGISDAFNKGIKKAKGEIVGLINADDWYEPNAVETAVKSLQKYDIVYGDIRLWKNEKPDVVFTGSHKHLVKEMTINHPTVFVTHNCYLKYGLFDTKYKYAMDYDFLLRLYTNGCSFVHVPSILANMRWDGTSDQHWFKACSEVLQIKNKYFPQKKLKNTLHFYKQVASIKLGKSLQYANLDFFVRFYRNKLSPIKKFYD
jgi:glycosyltransferase involved in cell wall biosynthesis